MNADRTAEISATRHVDYGGSKLGMWIFLFTEILFFGGLFLLYAVYRSKYLTDFHSAATELSISMGLVNTVVLITSSLTTALSVSAMKRNKQGQSVTFQTATIILGCVFLIMKYIEWSAKITHGIWPGSPDLTGQGRIIFYSLYFVMTGLHGLHVLIGIFFFISTLGMSIGQRITHKNYIQLENTGLYWHFVDIVWIYLFPLLYLIQ